MRPWYRLCWILFRLFFFVYLRGTILHADRLPRQGGVILAANHTSFLDPPLVGLSSSREIYYLARDTLMRNRLARRLLISWNSVPISRGKADPGAMRVLLRLLAEEKAVVMFPEGTRSRDGRLQPAQAGIGMVLARSGAPVVPMRLLGAERAMPRGACCPRPVKVTVIFGEPFTPNLPADLAERGRDEQKAVYEEIGREIMRRIAALEPASERRA
jgi:1-acyl-sn-glycerol-3-phosphate acyltransferase